MKLKFLVFLTVHNSSEASAAQHTTRNFGWLSLASCEKWSGKNRGILIYRLTREIHYKRFCIEKEKTTNSSQFWLSCSNDDSENKDNIFDHLRNWFGNQKVSDLWYIFPSTSLTTTSSITQQRRRASDKVFPVLRCSRNFLSCFFSSTHH